MVVQSHLLSLSAYIDQNLDKDLPLSSLAKRVGLSPFHFHRKFGAYFGESLHQHIKRLRLERAAFQLTHGARSVRDIALTSGYKTVSAFSHAFSGFAGESPTRYRSHRRLNGGVKGADGEADAPPRRNAAEPAMQPAWIGDLPPQPLAFVRAVGHGHGAQRSVREAMDTIMKIVEPSRATKAVAQPDTRAAYEDDPSAFEGDRFSDPAPAQPIEFVAATTDFYGIVKGGDFRIDLGLDEDRLPSDRKDTLGLQTLPGGRYARFDFVCTPAELIGHCYRAASRGWRGASENARTTSHFVRFTHPERGAEDEPRSYRFFLPVAD